tara:strand:+ start:59 stop:607 length:549 start_codon:yes stop_codon:yes gene_type:complete
MDTTKAIFKRRTVHNFKSKKVSEEILIKGIEAANQAPCHKLTFPWRFYSIGMNKRNQIFDLAVELKSKEKTLSEKAKNIIRAKYLNPSHLLIGTQILVDNDFTRKEDYAACSCAIQNLAISLASNEVQMKWSTGLITRDKRIYNIVELDSKKEEIIGFIWIGYGNDIKKISRPSITEIFKQI